jgi:arginine/serine-rich splicing factor 4/5/6
VEFSSYSDMKNALEKLDDTEINGRRIKLTEDKPKKRRWVLIDHVSQSSCW